MDRSTGAQSQSPGSSLGGNDMNGMLNSIGIIELFGARRAAYVHCGPWRQYELWARATASSLL